MKKIIIIILAFAPMFSYAQSAVYANLGTNFINFYGGIGIAGDITDNFRFHLSANAIQKDVEGLMLTSYQLEPSMMYKFNSENKARPFVSIGGYYPNPISRSNKEIEIPQIDVGLIFSIGLIEQNVSLAIEYQQGIINIYDNNKTMSAGIIFKVPISKPF